MSISNKERLQIASAEADELIDAHFNISCSKANKKLNKTGICISPTKGFIFGDEISDEKSNKKYPDISTKVVDGLINKPDKYGQAASVIRTYKLNPSDFKDFQSFLIAVSKIITENRNG